MIPTLQPGDVLWVTRCGRLDRGKVVVVGAGDDGRSFFVKRLVALPQDHVVLRDEALWINQKQIHEPYVLATAQLEPQAHHEWTLGDDDYLLLGDARDDSLDSRRWGPMSRSSIMGVVRFRLWPFRFF